jgi:CRISPR-associated endoribonuclease Cas6
LKGKFKRDGDRLILLEDTIRLKVCFHLPKASQVFVEGLFKSETIEIADKKSKAAFTVQSIVAELSPLSSVENEKEILQIIIQPESAIVAGTKKENGNYDFKAPDEEEFTESLIYSWREKIKAAYNEKAGKEAILVIEVEKYANPYRSRLIHIKAGRKEETKIRGFLNFKLKLTAEKRFLELVLNSGLGLYSAQGMGCVRVV